MRQARAQMVAGAVEKNLRLVFKAAERARMDDAGAIPLKFGAIGVTRFTMLSSARFARFLSNGRKHCALPFLHLFARLPFCAHLSGVYRNPATSARSAGRKRVSDYLSIHL